MWQGDKDGENVMRYIIIESQPLMAEALGLLLTQASSTTAVKVCGWSDFIKTDQNQIRFERSLVCIDRQKVSNETPASIIDVLKLAGVQAPIIHTRSPERAEMETYKELGAAGYVHSDALSLDLIFEIFSQQKFFATLKPHVPELTEFGGGHTLNQRICAAIHSGALTRKSGRAILGCAAPTMRTYLSRAKPFTDNRDITGA